MPFAPVAMSGRTLVALWLCGMAAAHAQYQRQYTQYPANYSAAPASPYWDDHQLGYGAPPQQRPLSVSARGIGSGQEPVQPVQPAYQQPAYQQPAYQQPAHQQPTPQQPNPQQPTPQQPTPQQPSPQQPTPQQPAHQQSAPQQPAQQPPLQQPAPEQPARPLAADEHWQSAVAQRLQEESFESKVDKLITRAVTRLALSLARIVETDSNLGSTNVVFSPVNVAAALALVLAGSNGTTFDEVAKVLGVSAGVELTDRERVHGEFGRYLGSLESTPGISNAANATGGNQVVFANGLFLQKEFKIDPKFLSIAAAYKSEVIPVDFAHEPTHTKDRVNSWFSRHTAGRIPVVLSEAPPADTRLMIASALFFNGQWEAPFPTEATVTRAFKGVSATGGTELFAVRMMTNNMELPFYSDRGLRCRLLELPYSGRAVSMFLILPDEEGLGPLRALEQQLLEDPDRLEGMLASRKDAPVIYTLPRMRLSRSISLRAALESLGVRTLFDERLADLTHLSSTVTQRGPGPAAAAPPTRGPNTENLYFSTRLGVLPDQDNNTVQQPQQTEATPELGDRWGVASQPKKPQHQTQTQAPQSYPARLYADDVLHKVEVEVTETGTAASAATAITISRDGSNTVMRFSRPFLFFIRHRASGLILFYGSVVRPAPDWVVPDVDPSTLTAGRPAAPPRRPLQPPRGRRPPQQRPPQSQGPTGAPPQGF